MTYFNLLSYTCSSEIGDYEDAITVETAIIFAGKSCFGLPAVFMK